MCMKNGKMYSCQEKENKNRCMIESAAPINSRFKQTCFIRLSLKETAINWHKFDVAMLLNRNRLTKSIQLPTPPFSLTLASNNLHSLLAVETRVDGIASITY